MTTEAWAESAGIAGECDRCHAISPRLVYVGYGDESSEPDGDWVYCGTCARHIMGRSDVMGRLVTT